MKIKDLMSENVIAVEPETPLKDVAAMLAEHRISGLPVVDGQRRVIGVISEADILVKERGPEARHEGLVGWLLAGGVADEEKLAARTAGEAMTSPAITVGPEKNVSEAARSMIEKGIKRLPIVDADGVLIGIVTRADLVRAFARTDAEITQEIREDVVRRTLWVDDDTLAVVVDRGEVTLSGELPRRTDAELLPSFVARVPGVISVRSNLTWRWDDHKGVPRSDPRVPIPARER